MELAEIKESLFTVGLLTHVELDHIIKGTNTRLEGRRCHHLIKQLAGNRFRTGTDTSRNYSAISDRIGQNMEGLHLLKELHGSF
jgi:hypothetical protein